MGYDGAWFNDLKKKSANISEMRETLIFGPAFEDTLRGVAVLGVHWSILYWMYKRKIFLRI